MAQMTALGLDVLIWLPGQGMLMAIEAGRFSNGLRATVQLWSHDGNTFYTSAQLNLSSRDAWGSFAEQVCSYVGVDKEATFEALGELTSCVNVVLSEREGRHEAGRANQAQQLVALTTQAGVELFHHRDRGYITLPVADHRETWPIRSNGLALWLRRQFYHSLKSQTVGDQALKDAVSTLESMALFEGPERPIFVRIAKERGAIYLDLANACGQVVEVDTDGWRVVNDAPVKFWRARGMLPLPVPEHGGELYDLQPFVNIGSDQDWVLLTAWIIAALWPTGPYPVLMLQGEQGSAKSMLTETLRGLIDPNEGMHRGAPREERDLMITANNGWVIALDNLSGIPSWLSDTLCRLSTGSAFATRQLHSDAEEVIFQAQRPIVINGITDLTNRGDLLDRAMILRLPSIPEDKRQDEHTLHEDFEAARPRILGAFLTAVSMALKRYASIRLTRKPRMADFVKVACAAAPACGWEVEINKELLINDDAFWAAYDSNRGGANELVIESAPVATTIIEWILHNKIESWLGTAAELLDALNHHIDDDLQRQKTWSSNPRGLRAQLDRLTPSLRAEGIEIETGIREGGGRRRLIQIQVQNITGSRDGCDDL